MNEAANDNVGAGAGKRRIAAAKPCPICGKPAQPEAEPFCSRRCADVDLHRWLGGVYAIPAAEGDDDAGSDPAG